MFITVGHIFHPATRHGVFCNDQSKDIKVVLVQFWQVRHAFTSMLMQEYFSDLFSMKQ